jgi:hypothetical protein
MELGERCKNDKGGDEPVHWIQKRREILIADAIQLFSSLEENLKKLHSGLERDEPEADKLDDCMDLIFQNVEENCKLFLDTNAKGREEPVCWTKERRNHLILLVSHLYNSVGDNLEKLDWYFEWEKDSDVLDYYLDLIYENIEENCKLFLKAVTINDSGVCELLKRYFPFP